MSHVFCILVIVKLYLILKKTGKRLNPLKKRVSDRLGWENRWWELPLVNSGNFRPEKYNSFSLNWELIGNTNLNSLSVWFIENKIVKDDIGRKHKNTIKHDDLL